MSRRREINRHRASLGEIREIMNAMKNLALMESNKLARLLSTQRRAVATIEAAAGDVLACFPVPEPSAAAHEVDILLGSERGFCGDFNERLIEAWRARGAAGPRDAIAVGNKLCARLAGDADVTARIDGPGVLEEVEGVLLRLMGTLTARLLAQGHAGALRISVFHHEPEAPEVRITHLDPLRSPHRAPRHGHVPRLNLAPLELLRKLTDHYLYAALHGLFYSSLMAENRRRMQHMEYAVQRIDEQSRELLVRSNVLRQEEITEEIEVIMLSTETAAR